MIEIDLLQSDRADDYEDFLAQCRDGLFYHSLQYRDVIRSFIEADDYYFIALKEKEIVGAFPAFLKQNSLYGNVINSLPFFGSHGAIVVKEPQKDKPIKKKLLDAFNSFAYEKNCLLATIITSPFDNDPNFYKEEWVPDFFDHRIAQISQLPRDTILAKEALNKFIDSNRRDAVRKAIKSEITIKPFDQKIDIDHLYKIHLQNITALKGIVKPLTFFQKVIDRLKHDKDYKLYYAEKEGEIIAGLLLFYYKDMVEYFTPAVKVMYRNLQPISLLIYEAMLDAIQGGFKYFNFGGTWESQKSLYKFKQRWGAKDYPYNYYIKAYSDIGHLKKLDRKTLEQQYPFFYVMPFEELED